MPAIAPTSTPTVQATSIANAVLALGIQALIDASVLVETNRAEAAETALDAAIASEAGTRLAADNALTAAIASEATTRAAADTTLQNNIDTLAATVGGLPTNATGSVRVGEFSTVSSAFDITFSPAFPTACVNLYVYPIDPVIDPAVFIAFTLVSASRVTGNLQDNFAVPVSGPVKYAAFGY